MNYSAPEWVLIITAGGLVITNAINAWRNGTKLDVIGQRSAAIEGHVNSKETKYVEQLTGKDMEIKLLRELITTKDRDKALLAQAAAMRGRTVDTETPTIQREALGVQKEIADNTAETAEAVKNIKGS